MNMTVKGIEIKIILAACCILTFVSIQKYAQFSDQLMPMMVKHEDAGSSTNTSSSFQRINDRNDDYLHEIHEYRKRRPKYFESWFTKNTEVFKPNADQNGTIMDFAIIGHPKCGTTTMEANLGLLAPMPIGDVCTPLRQTVWYAYNNWAEKYGNNNTKVMRGTKCPSFTGKPWINEYSKHLPRTKLIIGVRHPILWFESFYKMNVGNGYKGLGPYGRMEPCNNIKGAGCRNDCPKRQLFCMHRGSFHVSLARLGKTALTPEERMLLSAKSNPVRAGMNLENYQIRNPIFVYEMRELREDYIWDTLTDYLDAPQRINNTEYHGSHGKYQKRRDAFDICDEKYDNFRATMMLEAYDVSTWLQTYFLPVAKNESRTDVTIVRPDRFNELVEDYKLDPCGRLIRLDNGTYVLGQNFTQ